MLALIEEGYAKKFQSLDKARRVNGHTVLAKKQQTSPFALFKSLKIKPVTGPQIDGSRQYFYLKKHFL